jgi:hypothetical protein
LPWDRAKSSRLSPRRYHNARIYCIEKGGVAEEVIDGEKLREGSSLGVVFSSREDGVT